jgi:hypothetical protein
VESRFCCWKKYFGCSLRRFLSTLWISFFLVVIRMAGTLRIIINTNVWKDMVVNRLSDKNVSFSAFDTTDDNALKVFLISVRTIRIIIIPVG